MRSIVDVAHLHISILQINPSKALLNLHLNGSVFDIFQIAIFFTISFYCLRTIKYLLLKLLDLEA